MSLNSAEILREAAYEEGYKAGKLCAAQQILDDIEETLTEKQKQFNQKRKELLDIEYPEADSYWLGRSVTYGELLRLLEQMKNKYEIMTMKTTGEPLYCWHWQPSFNSTVIEDNFASKEETKVRMKELRRLRNER